MDKPLIDGRGLLAWALTLLAFPPAGLLARAIAGPVDAIWTAVLAGAIAGAVIGAAQWLALRRTGIGPTWIAATTAGGAAGLGLAYGVLGYGDSVGDLAVMGGVTGTGIGAAQWWELRTRVRGSLWWIPASAVAWALGWTVTTAIGVDPDDRWANPGLSGAATLTLLLGAVLWLLGRAAAGREPAA
ncbi:MAG TPA: hypothetical protein VK646_02660 [Actinomycetota bacterium]|nr:hypothetical protein [Actinomycetota bacterium]